MKNKIFIDSWGFISYLNKKEIYHRETCDYLSYCIGMNYEVYTSKLIITETIAFLFRNYLHSEVEDGIYKLLDKIENNLINCIDVNIPLIRKSIDLSSTYSDKPKISFIDFSSMVIMKENNINEILTMDKHFLQVNLGFQLKPEIIRT